MSSNISKFDLNLKSTDEYIEMIGFFFMSVGDKSENLDPTRVVQLVDTGILGTYHPKILIRFQVNARI